MRCLRSASSRLSDCRKELDYMLLSFLALESWRLSLNLLGVADFYSFLGDWILISMLILELEALLFLLGLKLPSLRRSKDCLMADLTCSNLCSSSDCSCASSA